MKIKLALCAMLSGAASLWAQIGTSTITGRVTDSTGAIVPAVKITAVQVATNLTSAGVTNNEGIYRILSLQPGQYKISFEGAGFKKAIETVDLRTGDTLAVDVALQVGNVAESVEVTGASPLLETETSATGTVMSGNVLYDLPLYQRFVNSTLNITPGMTTGGFAYGGDLGAYHLAGQRAGAIGVFEDGVNGNDQNSGTATIKPIQNAVAEVKVLTTVPPAEYGHSAGGVVSVVKKSGTNEIHGMTSWYGRTRVMQHRLFFDKFTTTQQNVPVLFMMPDANIGGPVFIPKVYDGRNKTFFFFGFQRLHEKKAAQQTATVPTLDMRAGNFTMGGIGNGIFDPASTRRNTDGTWARDPFPGNLVPQSRIDPVARKVLGFDPWVQPNQPGVLNASGPGSNYLVTELAKVFLNDYNLRLDHQFSPNFKIYGSWTENGYSGFQRPWNIRYDRQAFDGVAGVYAPSYVRNISAGSTWIVNPSMVNDLRVGYYRRWNATYSESQGQNWPSQLGIPNLDPALMPAFGSGDRSGPDSIYGLSGNTPNVQTNETISFRDDLSIIRGTHAFKVGYETLRLRLNYAIPSRPAQFSFAGVTAGLQANGATVPNTGNTFAGFLTGYVAQGIFQSELSSWLPRSYIHSFYVQDDWKITPNLTANIGLRYSNETPYTTKNGAMSNFDPTATDPLTGKLGAIVHPNGTLNRRDNNNFNPRLGLAWHPLQKFVFRGGIGMYTVDLKFPNNRGQYDEYTALVNQQSNPGDPTPIYRISQGPNLVKFGVNSNNTSYFVGTNYGSRSVNYYDPNLRNPYVLNWNSSIQYEVKRDYLLELSYQGSSGVGLVERWNINTFPVDYQVNNIALRNQVFAAAQNYRPYPQFGDIVAQSNFGHSTFHSGTVKLEKRMSKGLFFSTFYTYSKAIDSSDSDTSGGGVAPIQNRNLEKALAGYNRSHRYIGVVNYELPFGKGKKFLNSGGWKNYLLGGYEISFIQTIESGNPVNFSYTNSPYNYYPTFAGSRRPDVLSKVQLVDGWYNIGGDRFTIENRKQVYPISAFAYPGGSACPTTLAANDPNRQATIDRCSFLVGNAGRNIATGPRLLWAQVSAQKNVVFKERYKLQLRWDFQNAFKTYNFNVANVAVDFRNPNTFAKMDGDPRTASLGGQPLMNLTLMFQF